MDNISQNNKTTTTAVFGGGCFWCLDAVFRKLKGVEQVVSGFCGGEEIDPSYEMACSGRTGHIEVVQIEYQPQQIDFDHLLAVFFASHDPTQADGQGHDIGPQYRSVIFYQDQQQAQISRQLIDTIDNSDMHSDKIATLLRPAMPFYAAPSGHQDFYNNRSNVPYCQIVIRPKIDKVRRLYGQLLR